MNGGALAFRALQSQGQASTFVISGANSSTVVWDVTSPSEYKQIKGTGTVENIFNSIKETISKL